METNLTIYKEAKSDFKYIIAAATNETIEKAKIGFGISAAKFALRYTTPGKNQKLYDDIYNIYFGHFKRLKQHEETEKAIKGKFRNFSNQQLINRANNAPDFGWDDEGYELNRRRLVSAGKFNFTMSGNKLIIT